MARIYDRRRWRRLRLVKLAESPLCEECLREDRYTPAVDVDHIEPVSAGGDPFPPLEGLASLCKSHHSEKTARDNGGTLKGCDADGTPRDPLHWWHDAPAAVTRTSGHGCEDAAPSVSHVRHDD